MRTSYLRALGLLLGTTVLPVSPALAGSPSSPARAVRGDLTVVQLAAQLRSRTPPHVYDANELAAYRAGHVPGAAWIDTGDLAEVEAADFPADKRAELVFYCAGFF